MNYSIESLLIEAAAKQIENSEKGIACAGHNGPYFDEETPVRNCSHWLIIFACLFKRTGDKKYSAAAYRLAEYLKSSSARPMNASFYCRKKTEKDFCNGLMGQAWAVEALVYASDVFFDKSLYALAEEVFLKHEFDYDRNMWFRLAVDGARMSHDETFNHQLWFCAVGSQLRKSPDALQRCDLFFQNVGTKPTIYSNGVIFHNSNMFRFKSERKFGIKALIDNSYRVLVNSKNYKRLYSKSVGYHGFNLYAYELLKGRYSNHPFYKSRTFAKLLKVTFTNAFQTALFASPYSYAYNPPGFEVGYAWMGNDVSPTKVKGLLEKHFKVTKTDTCFNGGVSQDLATSEARLYELVRILDIAEIHFEL